MGPAFHLESGLAIRIHLVEGPAIRMDPVIRKGTEFEWDRPFVWTQSTDRPLG